MQARTSTRLGIAAALLCASACPTSLTPPTAVIAVGSSRDIGDDAGSCDEPAKSVATSVDRAPPIHAACSHDADGHRLTYHWSVVDQPSGATMQLSDPEVISPTLLADAPGRYRISLIVSNHTLTSPPAFITVEVDDCGARPPEVGKISVVPGTDVKVADLVSLTPSVSDPDVAKPCGAQADQLVYAWTFTRLPAGSQAAFNAESALAPSFVPDIAGTYEARLVVTDPTGRSASASVRVRARR